MNISIEQKAEARKNLTWLCKLPKSETTKAIGARIRELRKMYFISQQELANAIGFHSTTAIALIESGQRNISAYRLLCVAKFFGVSLSTFQWYFLKIKIGRENRGGCWQSRYGKFFGNTENSIVGYIALPVALIFVPAGLINSRGSALNITPCMSSIHAPSVEQNLSGTSIPQFLFS